MNLFSQNMISFLEDIGLIDLLIHKSNLVHDEKNPFYYTSDGKNIDKINNDHLKNDKKILKFKLEENYTPDELDLLTIELLHILNAHRMDQDIHETESNTNLETARSTKSIYQHI